LTEPAATAQYAPVSRQQPGVDLVIARRLTLLIPLNVWNRGTFPRCHQSRCSPQGPRVPVTPPASLAYPGPGGRTGEPKSETFACLLLLSAGSPLGSPNPPVWTCSRGLLPVIGASLATASVPTFTGSRGRAASRLAMFGTRPPPSGHLRLGIRSGE
jgi:hypothetical protein